MAERRGHLVDLAVEHGPCSVRHLFYQAVVSGVPGITKDDAGYAKVQRLVLELRRSGGIAYEMVTDSTRWMRKPTSWGSPEEALASTARFYRRDLWRTSNYRVEVWCESDSIASTIYDVTARWDVPLMVCRGYSSETFAYIAAEAWRESDKQPVVFYIGDHDPAGLNIEIKLRETLTRFADAEPEWYRLGVTWDQITAMDLPGTNPKKSYGFPIAVEAEALPPGVLRSIVENIEIYVDPHQLQVLEVAEQSERELLYSLAREAS
jgi:hypothetical protein